MPPKRAARKPASAQTKSRDNESEMDTMDGDEQGDLNAREENMKKSMAKDVSARNKVRKSEQQRQISERFKEQAHELEGQIEERVEEHQQEAKIAQDDFVSRLLALTQRKAKVEEQIIQNVSGLAEAYNMIKRDFQTVLHGRSEDVHKAVKALRDLQDDTRPNEQR